MRSKGAPRGPRMPRQASPRVLAIGGGIVALAVIGIVLGLVLGGGSSSGIPKGTPTVGRVDANSLPGAAAIRDLYKGIPQQGFYLGKANAPVQMVMFIDLQCPVCQDFEVKSLPTIVRKYVRTGNVRIHLRPWAFIGNDSYKGQDFAMAAAHQNKLFNFAGVLYDNQGPENSGWMSDSILAEIAASVPGLNVPKLFADKSSSATKADVRQVDSEASKDNVQGTPTILIGKTGQTPKDVTKPGIAPTLAEVEQAIDTALIKA
ncbi:MAG TPA: thioredoxin domain-containing protein [Gaiellaceae bacterium]|nr:thioredoxin domain-containing protein [Gaiellaceae bacterium]